MATKGLTYEHIMAAVQRHDLAPLYFLFGDEPFLMDEVQTAVVENSLQEHERDFNLDIVYGAEAEAQQVLSVCAGYPVMAQRRVVIVREFDKLKDNRLFTSYAERPNPTAIVLLVCSSRPNLATHPYRALKQHAAWVEFKALRPRDIPRWVESRMKRVGYRIEPRAAHMLGDFLGTDLRTAVQELEKLKTYAGERTTITADDVIRASGQSREHSVFELQKAIGEKRLTDAVEIAERRLQQAANMQGEVLMIVSILSSYFAKLWRLLACEGMPEKAMASRIGVPPYYIREYDGAVRRYGAVGVERAFGALLAADYEIKGGAARDARAIMLLLLTRLMSPGR